VDADPLTASPTACGAPIHPPLSPPTPPLLTPPDEFPTDWIKHHFRDYSLILSSEHGLLSPNQIRRPCSPPSPHLSRRISAPSPPARRRTTPRRPTSSSSRVAPPLFSSHPPPRGSEGVRRRVERQGEAKQRPRSAPFAALTPPSASRNLPPRRLRPSTRPRARAAGASVRRAS
jgi:hypothetical protein